MNSKLNSDVGNSSFVAKKEIYISSTFELTKELENYENWDTNAINERQENLAELALETWNV